MQENAKNRVYFLHNDVRRGSEMCWHVFCKEIIILHGY